MADSEIEWDAPDRTTVFNYPYPKCPAVKYLRFLTGDIEVMEV